MKWILIIGIGICSLLLILLCLLQLDDALDPKLHKIIATGDSTQQNDAYFYLLGFEASVETKPIDIGKIAYANIHQQEIANHQKISFEEDIVYEPIRELTSPKSELLCRYNNPQCLATIFSNLNEIPPLINEHHIYIDRLNEFLPLTDYMTLTKATLSEPIVNFSALVNALRLANLELIYLAHIGDPLPEIEKLFSTQTQLRTQLVQQDTLIGKLTLLSMISENIDLIYLISAQHTLPLKRTIEPLNIYERDLTNAFDREIRLMNNLYQSLDKAPDIFAMTNQEHTLQSPAWLTRALFKPNMTSNEGYRIFDYFVQLSTLEIEPLTEELLAQKQHPNKQSHWFRNPIGTILAQISTPDYAQYILRFWNLNNKINLFNTNLGIPVNKHHFQQVNNLYPALLHEKPHFINNKQQVCFNSPFDAPIHDGCLQIKVISNNERQ